MHSAEGKVYIVTGGLGGIGRVTARLLADVGAHIVVSDVVEAGGADFATELSASGPAATFFPADLVDEDQVRSLVGHAVERFGRLDGAFNNAAVMEHKKLLVELTSAEFDKVMRTNVLGTFHSLKHQMLAMKNGGSIVITSSALAMTALSNRAEYIASKQAVLGLTRAAAVEGAPMNIRVNAVLPGSTKTPMALASHGPQAEERASKLHLIARMGLPEEVGYAVRWLLSDEASFVTGASIPVEGGATAGRRA
jgi:2,5-dichloro-2,5-cyclohexadiene-1,4-diol dehydrogenase 1